MNINNYECDGQMSIEDFLVSNNQEVKRLLHSGEVVFEAIKGDVERHVVTDEHWYIEHLKTYGNRTRVHGAYCAHIIAAFEEAVYDEKKKNMDVRLDDGEMNVDSLDSTEYSTESIQDEIMYIAA